MISKELPSLNALSMYCFVVTECSLLLSFVVMAAQPIPLFETIFARCTIILLLTFLWLKRSKEPILEPRQTRKILLLRALLGYISLMGFVYRYVHSGYYLFIGILYLSPENSEVYTDLRLTVKISLVEPCKYVTVITWIPVTANLK